jgi:hypothetical protein
MQFACTDCSKFDLTALPFFTGKSSRRSVVLMAVTQIRVLGYWWVWGGGGTGHRGGQWKGVATRPNSGRRRGFTGAGDRAGGVMPTGGGEEKESRWAVTMVTA